jgi:hypothetical protein
MPSLNPKTNLVVLGPERSFSTGERFGINCCGSQYRRHRRWSYRTETSSHAPGRDDRPHRECFAPVGPYHIGCQCWSCPPDHDRLGPNFGFKTLVWPKRKSHLGWCLALHAIIIVPLSNISRVKPRTAFGRGWTLIHWRPKERPPVLYVWFNQTSLVRHHASMYVDLRAHHNINRFFK